MTKTIIKDVTLVCIDCNRYGQAVNALQKSMEQCEFDRVIFLTDIQFDVPGVETIIIPRINSKEEYSEFVIKQLYRYISTKHLLICQWDGYILNGDRWQESWKDYDVIGACWLETDGFNCANGGFSLRSKYLMELVGTDETIVCTHPEDSVLGRIYRPYLETHGVKFAPDEVCDAFSFELREPNQSTFGFHSFFHAPYRPTVVLKRSGALGDIISMEPLMHELYLQGNNVVLDVPAHLFDVFSNHWYPIKHISQFDAGRISARYVDLDMVYEVKPQQLHLKSYFEALGIEPKEYRNSKLTVGEQMRPLFDRYVVLHIDQRDTLPRNVYGVEWDKVVTAIHEKGYNVIQIGTQQREIVALNINTPTVGFLKWVIAGASYFIGVDSGPAQIAVACGVPAAIFFGSVDSSLIYPDLTNIDVIEIADPCATKKCWHTKPSTAGMECVEMDKNNDLMVPPCTFFNTQVVIDTINQKLK